MNTMTYDELREIFTPKIETGSAKIVSDATHTLIDLYENKGLTPNAAFEAISKLYGIGNEKQENK